MWKNPRLNPHAAQVTLNSPGYQYWVTPPFERVLNVDTAPERKYERTTNQIKTVIHWGQRKLLLSEIEFLTLIGNEELKEEATVVYAGAAPGTHIKYLAALFPSVNFILVDPAPFTVKGSNRIQLISDLFTDDLALELRDLHGPKIFFISDIRSADPDRDTPSESERKIKCDMDAQRRWHTIMKSKRSMFKFRLPWDNQCSEYLDGDVYIPIWGPRNTTESRLITREGEPGAVRTYDHAKYERQMCYFNCMTRVSLYQHDVVADGLDHCYDCTAETHILAEFLKMKNGSSCEPLNEIPKMIREMSEQVSSKRTLSDPNPDREERKRVIRRRQYVHGDTPAYEEATKRSKQHA